MSHHVAVIGAGLSGLAAARHLTAAGVETRVIDAADAPGGRVRTDEVDSFLLDRGFQVLLTGYPLLQRLADLDALDLRRFSPGALIFTGRARQRLADPLRAPLSATIATALATVGTPLDKLRLGRLRLRLTRTPAADLLAGAERSTLAELRADGFSEKFIDSFFRPFLGGVLLDPDLTTSARATRVIMRAFFTGDAALPAHGVQRLPEQLAEGLDIRLNHPITSLEQVSDARAVIVATEAPAAARLLDRPELHEGDKPAATIYYASRQAPLDEPILVLDATRAGPVTHLAVPSLAASSYAPAGTHLIAANVTGGLAARGDVGRLDALIRRHCAAMLDCDTEDWEMIASYDIPHGQPVQRQIPARLAPRAGDGVYLAGDHMAAASIEGALRAGLRAARAVLADLGVRAAAA